MFVCRIRNPGLWSFIQLLESGILVPLTKNLNQEPGIRNLQREGVICFNLGYNRSSFETFQERTLELVRSDHVDNWVKSALHHYQKYNSVSECHRDSTHTDFD